MLPSDTTCKPRSSETITLDHSVERKENGFGKSNCQAVLGGGGRGQRAALLVLRTHIVAGREVQPGI